MPFSLHYPTQASPTTSWTPSRDALVPSLHPEDDGMLVDTMADGFTTFAYGVADSRVRMWEFEFKALTNADRTNFHTFQAAVRGKKFEMVDPASGTVFTVKFAPDAFKREWRWDPPSDTPWSVTLEFQQVT